MHVTPRDGETFEQLLRRFDLAVKRSGILREYTQRRRFRTTGDVRRARAEAARRRRRP